MTDDHTKVFVAESKDHVTELNNGLLAIEDSPDDQEAMDAVFRTAHTLKGNFGAMGYENAMELAHALEDLLDEVREGDRAVTPEIMDVAFQALDRIEEILSEIERDGEPSTEPTEEIETLRRVIEEGEVDDGADETEIDDGADETEIDDPTEFADDGDVPHEFAADEVVHARVQVGNSQMPAVDGTLVLEAISESFDQFETTPSPEDIEDGEYPEEFDVFVPTDDETTVAETLEGANPVEEVSVAALDAPTGGSNATESPAENGERPEASGGESEQSEEDASGEDDTTDGDDPAKDDAKGGSSTGGGDEIKSIRIDADRLDELHGLVEELVTTRITIQRAIEAGEIETARNSMKDFDKVTTSLQDTVTDMRLIPLRKVVRSLPRVVRDTAREAEKEVDFEIHGDDVEIDRTILSKLDDPLIHILRNAVDHGIEPPAERETKGKPRTGHVELRARRDRDYVIIEVEDDGRGLDADDIRERAREQGIVSEAELDQLEDDDVYDLVFHPGFSTSDTVTDISGRGVGMDVVHRTVTQLDGTVDVSSDPGEGTTVTLRLPVSVAIVDVLFVQVGDREFGIPIKTIDEVSPATEIERLNNEAVVRHDGDIYPVIHLSEALSVENGVGMEAVLSASSEVATDGGSGGGSEGMLIRIRASERPVALHCDAVNDQEEVVIKPMDGILSGIDGLSGTAILGDGNIVPILDVVTL